MRPLAAAASLLGLAGTGALGLRARREGEPDVCRHGCRFGNPRYHAAIFPGADNTRAAAEEGIDLEGVSLFGRIVPKVPRSEIKAHFHGPNNTKTIRFNFMGCALNQYHYAADRYQARRAWVLDFAKRHFSDEDYLNIVDVPPSWVPLGTWDKSYNSPGDRWWRKGNFTKPAGRGQSMLELSAQEADHRTRWRNETEYRRVMASSRYTFCPGGDAPWSFRSFDAVASYSLPVIWSNETDWRPCSSQNVHGSALQVVMEKMHRVTVAELFRMTEEEVRTAVEDNWRTFLRYFTFMEGDNVPEGLLPCTCDGETYLKCENDSCCTKSPETLAR